MDTLIFVYNADSGILNGLKDLLHKNFSPKTYPCSLCALTYDNHGMMIHDWADFVKSLNRQVVFLHRDELKSQYSVSDVQLPAAFLRCMNEKPSLWLDSDSLNQCKSLNDLKELVHKRLMEN